MRVSGVWFSVCVAVAVVFARGANATVMTMSGDYCGSGASPGVCGDWGNGSTIVDEYGDRVTSLIQTNVVSDDFGGMDWYTLYYDEQGEGFTPNVVAGYKNYFINDLGQQSLFNRRSDNDAPPLLDVAYPASGTSARPARSYTTFVADPGYLVNLISFGIGRFNNTSSNITLSVYAGGDPDNLGAQLFTTTEFVVGSNPKTIVPNVTGQALTLEFVYGNAGDLTVFNWAYDNIKFAQLAVPEPGCCALISAALIGLCSIRRRANLA